MALKDRARRFQRVGVDTEGELHRDVDREAHRQRVPWDIHGVAEAVDSLPRLVSSSASWSLPRETDERIGGLIPEAMYGGSSP